MRRGQNTQKWRRYEHHHIYAKCRYLPTMRVLITVFVLLGALRVCGIQRPVHRLSSYHTAPTSGLQPCTSNAAASGR